MTREEALEILGLEPNAPLSEARTAYRRLSKFYHPDKNQAPNAAVMFRIINEAWEFIEEEIAQEALQKEVESKKAEAEAASKYAEEARQRAKEAERAAKEAKSAAETSEKEKEAEDETSTSFLGWFVAIFVIGIIRSVIDNNPLDLSLIVRILLISAAVASTARGIAKLYRWFRNR